MKKMLSGALCLAAISIWSCSDNNNTTASGANADSSGTTTTAGMGGGGDTMNAAGSTANTANTTSSNMSSTPLSKMDSTFVMEAAVGGMTEVAAGTVAQQNAASDRVKAFGSMMVTDHSKANDELKSLASSHGLTVPSALPAAKQKDVDNMQKMTGKAFDMHYTTMMVADHKKTIDLFKKASTSATDPDLKNWATKTLPTLQMHLDSIQAIKNGKM